MKNYAVIIYLIFSWLIIIFAKRINKSFPGFVKGREYRSKCRYYSKLNCPNQVWPQLRRAKRSVVALSIRKNNLTSLQPYVMKRFKFLKQLDISKNNIDDLYGSLRRNRYLTIIDASDNKLGTRYGDSLRRTFYSNPYLKKIIIRRNGIRRLSGVMMGKRNILTILDASENDLRMVNKNTIMRLVQLVQLHLQQNKITYIHKDAFKNNKKLRYLDVGGNFIRFANNKLNLRNNINLKTFLIYDNRLESLQEIDLSRNKDLKNLDLSLNYLTKIDDLKTVLASNVKLLQLNLSYNDIKKIEPDLFQNLSTLEILDLSANDLQEINAKTFKNMKQLKNLSLAINLLTELPASLLKYNVNLRSLNLERNLLKHWKPYCFENNKHLAVLDMSENRFSINEINYLTQPTICANLLNNRCRNILHQNIHIQMTRVVLQRLECLGLSATATALYEGNITPLHNLTKKTCVIEANEPSVSSVSWKCGCNQQTKSSEIKIVPKSSLYGTKQ